MQSERDALIVLGVGRGREGGAKAKAGGGGGFFGVFDAAVGGWFSFQNIWNSPQDLNLLCDPELRRLRLGNPWKPVRPWGRQQAHWWEFPNPHSWVQFIHAQGPWALRGICGWSSSAGVSGSILTPSMMTT